MSGRGLSGLQRDVLRAYRDTLRVLQTRSRTGTDVSSLVARVQATYREDRVRIPRMAVDRIERRLREASRIVRLLSTEGIHAVTTVGPAAPPPPA
jgi:hypothetical protein